MFNRIRNSIASLIAVKAADTPATRAADLAADKYEQQRRQAIHQAQFAQQSTEHKTPLVGSVTTEHILDFSSKYARSAIAQLGAWSAIARGFSEFVKNPKSDKLEGICFEFHAWNAAAGDGEMSDEATLETICKLSVVKPAKGTKDTDAIIARVLHKSIEEVRADREAKAAVATKKREEAIIAFNSLLWSNVHSDGTYSMPAEKVRAKLEQTLLWMAGWDTNNPAALAAELLLLEADMSLVTQIGKQAVGAEADFEDGVLTADGMIRRSA